MGGLSSDQQILLALQRNQQLDSQNLLRLQPSQLDREALLGLSTQNQGFGALAPGPAGGGATNDRLLLQLLNERQRQQASIDPLQQELQRQALARELAEREYERSLLQRLQAVGGAPAPGRSGPSLGLGNPALTSLGASAESPLARSQAIMEQARLSSLLGSQLPSPLLQGANNGGLPPGSMLGGQGLTRGASGPPPIGYDDSITLEARSKQAFPLKLYRMLERAERNGQDDIISFIDEGKAFAIHKPRAFETDIMPSYFNSHRLSSFQRQLNIYVSANWTNTDGVVAYQHSCLQLCTTHTSPIFFFCCYFFSFQGFERINDGIQKGAYRHKFFIKGKKDFLEKIKRPQKLRQGAGGAEEEDETVKLHAMAAEHLVGLSKTSGGEDGKNKSDSKDEEKSEEVPT